MEYGVSVYADMIVESIGSRVRERVAGGIDSAYCHR
jgi:hypothetical protein